MPRRLPSTFTIVALVFALAGLVAVASHGTPVWTLVREEPADRRAILLGLAVLWAFGTFVAAVVVVLVHRALVVRGQRADPLRRTIERAVPITVAALSVASLLAIARAEPGPRAGGSERPGHVVEESGRTALPLTIDWWASQVRAGEDLREGGQVSETEPDPGPGLPLLLLLAAAALATMAAGVAWWRFGGRTSRAGAPDHEEDRMPDANRAAMHGALVSTIDAMLADPDPNTAIRGAYARLLEGLAASGTPRREHEAPVEHLHRVLTVLEVRPAPLRHLIDLFGIARFSTHSLSSSHREQALGALRAVARDLGSPSAPRPDAGSRGRVGAEP